VAPGIAAPVGSVTRPVNPVLAPVCAETGVRASAQINPTPHKLLAALRSILWGVICASSRSLQLFVTETLFDPEIVG
jgi:hypothetical protein